MLVGNRRRHETVSDSRLRQAACLIFLAAVGQSLALPIVDHHALEYSPWHSHLVLSAGSAQAAAWAITHHHHTFEQQHPHDPATGLPFAPETPSPSAFRRLRVLVIGGDPGRLIASFVAVDLGPTAASGLGLPPVWLWQPIAAVDPLAIRARVSPPLPPPRAA
jgi:hypothetical protein